MGKVHRWCLYRDMIGNAVFLCDIKWWQCSGIGLSLSSEEKNYDDLNTMKLLMILAKWWWSYEHNDDGDDMDKHNYDVRRRGPDMIIKTPRHLTQEEKSNRDWYKETDKKFKPYKSVRGWPSSWTILWVHIVSLHTVPRCKRMCLAILQFLITKI